MTTQDTPTLKGNYEGITIIEPSTGISFPNIRELWDYREYMWAVIVRNFTVTYRQTVGGPFYAVYEPLMSMVGYSILLGGIARLPTEGIPYPIYSFSALIIWSLFTGIVSGIASSLINNSNILQKIYIPRLVFPVTVVFNRLVGSIIPFTILFLMLLAYGYFPTAKTLMLPVYIIISLMFALGIGLSLAGLYAWFRDTKYILGLISRGLFFLTPVVYSVEVLPEPWNTLYIYNPMAVVVNAFRAALLDTGPLPTASQTLLALTISFIALLFGLLIFRES